MVTTIFRSSGVFLLALTAGWPGGESAAATDVFRCVGTDGAIEFRQGRCPAGDQQRLRIESPLVGWIKPSAGKDGRPESRRKPSDRPVPERPAAGAAAADALRCWKSEQKLQRIQWRRRKGYSLSEGEEMRLQQAEEESFQRRFCRAPD